MVFILRLKRIFAENECFMASNYGRVLDICHPAHFYEYHLHRNSLHRISMELYRSANFIILCLQYHFVFQKWQFYIYINMLNAKFVTSLNLLTTAGQLFAYPLTTEDHFSGSNLAIRLYSCWNFRSYTWRLVNHLSIKVSRASWCKIIPTRQKLCGIKSSILWSGHFILWLSPHNFVYLSYMCVSCHTFAFSHIF